MLSDTDFVVVLRQQAIGERSLLLWLLSAQHGLLKGRYRGVGPYHLKPSVSQLYQCFWQQKATSEWITIRQLDLVQRPIVVRDDYAACLLYASFLLLHLSAQYLPSKQVFDTFIRLQELSGGCAEGICRQLRRLEWVLLLEHGTLPSWLLTPDAYGIVPGQGYCHQQQLGQIRVAYAKEIPHFYGTTCYQLANHKLEKKKLNEARNLLGYLLRQQWPQIPWSRLEHLRATVK